MRGGVANVSGGGCVSRACGCCGDFCGPTFSGGAGGVLIVYVSGDGGGI